MDQCQTFPGVQRRVPVNCRRYVTVTSCVFALTIASLCSFRGFAQQLCTVGKTQCTDLPPILMPDGGFHWFHPCYLVNQTFYVTQCKAIQNPVVELALLGVPAGQMLRNRLIGNPVPVCAAGDLGQVQSNQCGRLYGRLDPLPLNLPRGWLPNPLLVDHFMGVGCNGPTTNNECGVN